MQRIALTGGIGSGKSTVAREFQRLGAPILSADAISHDLVTKPGPVLTKIIRHFGTSFVRKSGGLNRARMAEHIFRDHAAKKHLENILHPAILKLIQLELTQIVAPYTIIEIPLYVEIGPLDFIDRVLVVDCQPETQYARALLRDNRSPKNVRQIINSQVRREERLRWADDVIQNEASEATLRQKIVQLDQYYRQLALAQKAD